jgi:cell division protein FtsL
MSNVRAEYTKVAAPKRLEETVARKGELFQHLIIVMVLLTVVSVFHVWSRVQLIDINLKISEAGRNLKQLQQDNERLRVEVGSLKSPARIEALAKGELGMELPSEQQVVLVR